jgi:tetratricopeptide (TPR) repeat protein
MERAGALHLAFAMLGVMRALFAPSAGARADALVLVQQARVARQLGDVATAAELYDLADGVGRQHRIPEARGRAAVGRGILANMRGNYPEARADFRRALAIGDGLPGVTLLAHHGLMVAALAARDADTALVHGWQAFAGTLGDADRRADLLVNLGEIARTAGSPDAAASCHAAALRLTRLERLRMAALGGSVQAAADLHDVARLARLAREAVAAVRDAAQPYDRAMLLLELAEAHARVALDAPARRHADAARTIAAEQPFHEVTHRLDAVHAILAARAGVDARVPVAGVAPARLTAAARTVLARLRQLPDDADALLSLVA